MIEHMIDYIHIVCVEQFNNIKEVLLKNVHKKVGSVRSRLLLELSEDQLTEQRRRRPPPETAARWRCVPLSNNLTAHFNSQFGVSFHFCFHWEALRCL